MYFVIVLYYEIPEVMAPPTGVIGLTLIGATVLLVSTEIERFT